MPTYTTSAKHALRRLVGSNVVSDVDAGIAALADDVDSKMAVAEAGTLALRPVSTAGSPGKLGRFYRVTDKSNRIDFDHGTGWIEGIGASMYPIVTSLPGSPADGDAISLRLSDNLYPCRYVTALAGWLVENPLGNAPLYAAEANIASDALPGDSVWGAYGGPTLSLSVAMDAMIRAGAAVSNSSGAASTASEFGVTIGAEGTPGSPIGAIPAGLSSDLGSSGGSAQVLVSRVNLSLGAVVRHMSRSLPGNGGNIRGRWLEVYPTRIR